MITSEDISNYNRILFDPCDQEEEIKALDMEQTQNLATYLSQKIAFESVYKPSLKQIEVETPENTYHAPSFTSYICCCLYPEHYQSTFNITTAQFRSKICRTFMFWRNDFLETQPVETADPDQPVPKPDIYGPLWLILTYILILSLAANLNDFFGHGSNQIKFHFHPQYLTHAVAINVLFRVAEILIYPAVMGCLDGELSNTECTHLVGYSILLYMIPTCVCIIPKKTLHNIMLILAAALRGIFLGRNFNSRLTGKMLIIYCVVGGAEALYFFLVAGQFFQLPTEAQVAHGATVTHFQTLIRHY